MSVNLIHIIIIRGVGKTFWLGGHSMYL